MPEQKQTNAEYIKETSLNAMKALVYGLAGDGLFQYTVKQDRQYVFLFENNDPDDLVVKHRFIREIPLSDNPVIDITDIVQWFEIEMYARDAMVGGL